MRSNIDLSAVWPEWKIVRRINRGSFGVVYEAVRTDYSVESRAAIKVISIPQDEAELDSMCSVGLTADATKTYLREVVNDFANEIRLMESFKGFQNIVSVEDYKVVERTDRVGWDIYIRMELLTPLNTYISDKILSEREVVELGCDICSALERCAQRGVIHRDIKPDNIFLNEFGDYKLGDFGVARTLENMTGGLSQKGTYNYMAPEVEKGSSYNATVDIYSLGIVLYWLLNKRRLPFVSTEKKLLSPHDLVTANRRRLDGEPLPAPCNASPAMAEVILKACDPDPRKRFASAEKMKNALKSVADGRYGLGSGMRQSEPKTEDTAWWNHLEKTVTVSHHATIREHDARGHNGAPKKMVYIAAILFVLLAVGGGTFLIFRGKGREGSVISGTDYTSEELIESSNSTDAGANLTAEADFSETDGEPIAENYSEDTDEKTVIESNTGKTEEKPVLDLRRSVDDVYPPIGSFFTYDGHTYCFYDVYSIDKNEYGNVTSASEDAYNHVSSFCNDQGGHLAIINSYEENEALFSETQERYDRTVFFGLSDQEKEGQWIWDDGTENTLDLWAYKSGYQQPDNGHGFSYENYAEYDYDANNPAGSDNTGKWNDAVYLKNTSIFICEWDYLLKGITE